MTRRRSGRRSWQSPVIPTCRAFRIALLTCGARSRRFSAMTASSRGTAPGFSIGIERRTKGNSMSTAHHFRSAFVPHDLPEPRAGAAQGPLAGLTAAVKDMYDIADPRTCGVSPYRLAAHGAALADGAAVWDLLLGWATI